MFGGHNDAKMWNNKLYHETMFIMKWTNYQSSLPSKLLTLLDMHTKLNKQT
jgi:hypothetical protein